MTAATKILPIHFDRIIDHKEPTMMKSKSLFSELDEDFSAPSDGKPENQPAAGNRIQQAFAADDPTPYHNRSLTSRAAAESARSFVRSQAVRISEFLHSRGEHGATDREIQSALAMDGNSERPRRLWLQTKEFITPNGMLRDGSTVWVSVRPYRAETNDATEQPAVV